jgi:hypothetical protein
MPLARTAGWDTWAVGAIKTAAIPNAGRICGKAIADIYDHIAARNPDKAVI